MRPELLFELTLQILFNNNLHKWVILLIASVIVHILYTIIYSAIIYLAPVIDIVLLALLTLFICSVYLYHVELIICQFLKNKIYNWFQKMNIINRINM